MNGDMPAIYDSGHSHSVYSPGNLAVPTSAFIGTTAVTPFFAANRGIGQLPLQSLQQIVLTSKKQEAPMTARRLVQVYIADPDDNVPLDRAMLYSGEQKLTDATDQELFFEIDMKTILDRYNDDRVKLINRKVKERTEYLEPVKIRDLKMVVVSVATF